MSIGSKKNNAKVLLLQVVDAILYRLKTGCQWRELPTKQFFDVAYSWKSVYYHFRRWCRDGSWERFKEYLFDKYRTLLDMSCIQLDGSHTPVKRGGESFGYQGRKKCKTTNMLFVCDNQGIPITCSQPIAGNHHDTFELDWHIDKMLKDIKKSNIRTDGLFLNADSGFDTDGFRTYCFRNEIFANIDFNPRNGKVSDRDYIFDQQLYKRRFVIERTNAWIDAFKALLIRFDTKDLHWRCWHLIAFCCILIRKL